MGAINNDGYEMFGRFNTNNDRVLDAKEIAKAKQAGFDFFSLKNNITEDEFCNLYENYQHQVSGAEYEEKRRAVHVKYLQIQYNTKEPISDKETIAGYEKRLKSGITISNAESPSVTSVRKDDATPTKVQQQKPDVGI